MLCERNKALCCAQPHTQARVEHARSGHADGDFGVKGSFGFCAESGGRLTRRRQGERSRLEPGGSDRGVLGQEIGQVRRAQPRQKPGVFGVWADDSGDTKLEGCSCLSKGVPGRAGGRHPGGHGGPRDGRGRRPT